VAQRQIGGLPGATANDTPTISASMYSRLVVSVSKANSSAARQLRDPLVQLRVVVMVS
jgi:hypothetical protein